MQIRNLKQVLNHRLVLKKLHWIVRFHQGTWLKPYIDMNRQLRKKAKNDFEKILFKLINNIVFPKTMENVRKLGDIRPGPTTAKRNYLVSQPNYYTTIFFQKIY